MNNKCMMLSITTTDHGAYAPVANLVDPFITIKYEMNFVPSCTACCNPIITIIHNGSSGMKQNGNVYSTVCNSKAKKLFFLFNAIQSACNT